MAFSGTWKRTGAENAIAMMSHVGIPAEMIEKLKTAEVTMVLEQNGDVFKETLTVGEKVTKETYVVGKESDFTTWNDQIVKSVPKSAGENKFKVEYTHNGVHHSAIRELTSPTEFVDHVDLDHGKVVGKFIYSKCC